MTAETALKLNVKQAVPFFGVSSMEKSLRFYIDGLGFRMTNSWIAEGRIRWCWPGTGTDRVHVQEHRGKEPNSWKLLGKVGTGVTICFQSEDALLASGGKVAENVRRRDLSWAMRCGS